MGHGKGIQGREGFVNLSGVLAIYNTMWMTQKSGFQYGRYFNDGIVLSYWSQVCARRSGMRMNTR